MSITVYEVTAIELLSGSWHVLPVGVPGAAVVETAEEVETAAFGLFADAYQLADDRNAEFLITYQLANGATVREHTMGLTAWPR